MENAILMLDDERANLLANGIKVRLNERPVTLASMVYAARTLVDSDEYGVLIANPASFGGTEYTRKDFSGFLSEVRSGKNSLPVILYTDLSQKQLADQFNLGEESYDDYVPKFVGGRVRLDDLQRALERVEEGARV